MSPDVFDKKSLAQYRMERAFETLRAAQMLYKQDGDPASIVNRAYYAMFYSALAMLITIGKGTSKHSGVLSLFDQYFVKPGILQKEMSRFLHTSFDMRLTGDYEDKAEITQQEAFQILEVATHFINPIAEKLSGQP